MNAEAKEAAIGMTLQRMSDDKSVRHTRLEATEALELYMTKINNNVAVLNEQTALLQAAFVERNELLREIQAGCNGEGTKTFPTSATERE
jgi:hypothetical protein